MFHFHNKYGLRLGIGILLAGMPGLPALARQAPARVEWESIHHFASSEAEEAAQAALSSRRATAVSFALVDGDRFTQTGVFGFRDRISKDQPLDVTVDTEFGIGQNARILTVLAVLKLVEQGRVRLEDPVTAHLPDFEMKSPGFRDITVRMLLGHAAGFPGTDTRNLYTTWPMPRYADQVLETLAGQYLKYEPGTLRTPGGDGFTLAELVVERASGRPFAAFVKEEILDPLDMTRCGFPTTCHPAYPCARVFLGGVRQPQEFANGHGACGFYAAPEEMAKLMRMILEKGRVKDGQLFTEASIREMGMAAFPQAFDPMPSPLTTHGLGWDTVHHPALDEAGVRAWSIRGDTPHYGSAMIVVPGEALGIFVAGAGGFTGKEATALAERTLLRALVCKGRLEQWPRPPQPAPGPELSGAAAQVPGLLGLYGSSDGAFRVKQGDLSGRLRLERFDLETGAWDPLARDLKLRPDGWFSEDDAPGTAYHMGRADGRQYLACRWTDRFSVNRIILAERLGAEEPLAPFWAALKGRRWVLVNEPLDAGLFDRSVCLGFMTLPGFDPVLFVQGPAFHPFDTRRGLEGGGEMLRIPGSGSQDLAEPRPFLQGSELWMRYGSRVYRPLESLAALDPGPNPLSFGDGRRLEWRRVPPGAHLLLEGAVVVWKLYDTRFQVVASGRGAGRVAAPPAGAGYLAVQGGSGRQGMVRMEVPGG